jgi:2-C-methyl-D-erythritol 2,4-cyclodiphosphate synthase
MTAGILPAAVSALRASDPAADTIAAMRIGHGYDAHRFAEGRKLMLGGVEVPHGTGLAGHSDGDALLHAIIDALLGAAALGDIGAMFPSSDVRWKDAASIDLLVRARMRVRDAGHRIANVDATLVGEEPRIAPYVMEMRRLIAEALLIDITDVSVKGTTADGLGFTGRSEGVAASAVVLLE